MELSELNSERKLSSNTKSHVGKRISISRCDDDKSNGSNQRKTRSQKFAFLSAEIVNFCELRNQHTIRFDRNGKEELVELHNEDFSWLPQIKKNGEEGNRVLRSEENDDHKNQAKPRVDRTTILKRTLRNNASNDDRNHALVGKRFQYITSSGKKKNYTIKNFDINTKTHNVLCDDSTKLRVVDFKTLHNCRWLDCENTTENDQQREKAHEIENHSLSENVTYHGVYWSKRRNLWIAMYTCADRRIKNKNLGAFSDARHAALVFYHEVQKNSRNRENLNFPHEEITEEQINRWNSDVKNHLNETASKPKLSQYRGLSLKKNCQKTWIAQVNIEKILVKLGKDEGPYEIGEYETEIKAALAFDRLCRKHGVDEMGLNFHRNVPISKLRLFDASCHYCHKEIAANPVATKCNHVFCYSCIFDFLKEEERCPCCQTDMKIGDSSIRYITLKDKGNFGTDDNVIIDAVSDRSDGKSSQLTSNFVSRDTQPTNILGGEGLVFGMKNMTSIPINQNTNLISPEGPPRVQTRASGKRKILTFDDDELDLAKRRSFSEEMNLRKTKKIGTTELENCEIQSNCFVTSFRTSHNTRSASKIVQERLVTNIKNSCYKKKLSHKEDRYITRNQKSKKWEKSNDIDISILKKGDRTAFDFGNQTYFGSIINCNKQSKDEEEWSWIVLFDDGEIYEFDHNDMIEGASLYQEIKQKELSDPLRMEKLKKLRDDHLAEKSYILSKIPTNVKAQFLEIGFALWRGSYRPVLFLGPYHIPPGDIRNTWHQEFYKLLMEKPRIDDVDLPRIVYWFGQLKLDNGFSIIKGKNCISFDEGWRKGFKIKQKKTKSWQLMEEALGKPKHRRNPFPKMKEDYEYVLGPKADRLLVELEAEWKDRGWK